jgi:hypothetical protein
MRAILLAAIAGAGCLWTPPAKASFVTGQRLYEDCTVGRNDPAYDAKNIACVMFITGVHDMLELSQSLNDEARCVPDGLSAGQLRDTVVTYIRNNPQQREFDGAALVVIALQRAYNCIVPTTQTRGGSQSR